MINRRQAVVKRAFDIALAAVALVLCGWLIAVLVVAARIDTGQSGLYRQVRVGRRGAPFTVLKVRTMRTVAAAVSTTVTTSLDPRVTGLGRLLRRFKLDELPQLLNVLAGDMSIVGPRPDVHGWYDALEGPARRVLELRPGLTSPAVLAYGDEEALLAAQPDPERFNRDVLFPAKVALNIAYLDHYSLGTDIRCVVKTLGLIASRITLGSLRSRGRPPVASR